MMHGVTEREFYGGCMRCPNRGDLSKCRVDIDCCGFGTEAWHFMATLEIDNASPEMFEYAAYWIKRLLRANKLLADIKGMADHANSRTGCPTPRR